MIDLTCYVDEDNGTDGKAQNDINEEVLNQALRVGVHKYDHEGIITSKNGGNYYAFGAMLQTLLIINPLKNFFVEEKWRTVVEITKAEPVVCEILSRYFKKNFQKQIQYLEFTEIDLKESVG